MKFNRVFEISWIKTIYVNLNYFNLKTAIRFPILIGSKVLLTSIKGKIILGTQPRFGLVLIQNTELNLNGTWIINGKVRLKGGYNSLIYTASTGLLESGENLLANGSVAINCVERIKFGNNCLLAHNIEILDTDFHAIIDINGNRINHNKGITLGDRVWIGSNSIILKGVKIENDIIIGAGSILTKDCVVSNGIYGGNPAKLIKTGTTWVL